MLVFGEHISAVLKIINLIKILNTPYLLRGFVTSFRNAAVSASSIG